MRFSSPTFGFGLHNVYVQQTRAATTATTTLAEGNWAEQACEGSWVWGSIRALANAEHEGDKWRIRNERKRFLQQLSALVARRNYAIFNNASPRRGGEAPAAPPVAFE